MKKIIASMMILGCSSLYAYMPVLVTQTYTADDMKNLASITVSDKNHSLNEKLINSLSKDTNVSIAKLTSSFDYDMPENISVYSTIDLPFDLIGQDKEDLAKISHTIPEAVKFIGSTAFSKDHTKIYIAYSTIVMPNGAKINLNEANLKATDLSNKIDDQQDANKFKNVIAYSVIENTDDKAKQLKDHDFIFIYFNKNIDALLKSAKIVEKPHVFEISKTDLQTQDAMSTICQFVSNAYSFSTDPTKNLENRKIIYSIVANSALSKLPRPFENPNSLETVDASATVMISSIEHINEDYYAVKFKRYLKVDDSSKASVDQYSLTLKVQNHNGKNLITEIN